MKTIKNIIRTMAEIILFAVMSVIFFIAYGLSPKVRRNVNNDFYQ